MLLGLVAAGLTACAVVAAFVVLLLCVGARRLRRSELEDWTSEGGDEVGR
jgi:hypothetical protein